MIRPRVLLLLGATGRLGRAVLPVAQQDWLVDAPGRVELDVTTADWDAEIARRRPDAILNCAALALVDACDDDPERAEAVNAVAPGAIAAAAIAAGVAFVHVSTDYVFGDRPGPFAEDAPYGPVQRYGATKQRGEEAVRAQAEAAAGAAAVSIARVSWVFGPTSTAFADHVLGQPPGAPVPVRVRQRSRPTYAPALALWLLALCARLADGGDAPRILHPAGGPEASRADWARALLDAAGRPDVPVIEQRDDGRMRAPRPDDSRLDATATTAWSRDAGLPSLGDWRVHIAAAGATPPPAST